MNQQDPRDSRNLIIAMGLVMLIMVGWGYFRPDPQMQVSENQTPLKNQEITATAVPQALSSAPSLKGSVEVDSSSPSFVASGSVASLNAANGNQDAPSVPASRRLKIQAPGLEGSLQLVGAKLDDLKLPKYLDEVKSDKSVQLLRHGQGTGEEFYSIEGGWIKGLNTHLTLPDSMAQWETDQKVLSPETPVTLRWKNPEGVTFERTYEIDEEALITVTDRIINTAGKALEVAHYAQILRENPPSGNGFAILHEGLIGHFEDGLQEIDYSDVNTKQKSFQSTTGWAGVSDKYWLTALIPSQKVAPGKYNFTYRSIPGATSRRYLVEAVSELHQIAPGAQLEKQVHIFAGAKVLASLDLYEQKLGVDHLDKAVDFGKFYFLTKPIFKCLTFLKEYLGNFGIAILVLTVLIKLLLFPVANKSFRSMARMKALKPKLDRLREQHGDDRMKFAQAQMELFKKEKVNPMAGCLPMLAQIPVFFALYKVLFISIEMRHAPFFGWIKDLSAPDPTSIVNLFGLLPFDAPSFLQIGVWPIIMGASMFLQQKLNPTPQDPMQEKMFMVLPVVFTFMLANFPAGLVIYWTWNNLLSIAQQLAIMKLEDQSVRKNALAK